MHCSHLEADRYGIRYGFKLVGFTMQIKKATQAGEGGQSSNGISPTGQFLLLYQ